MLMSLMNFFLVIDYFMSNMLISLAKSFSCFYGDPDIDESAIQM